MKQYIEECNQYQRIKNRAEMSAGKLRPNEILERLEFYFKVTSI